MTRQRVVERRNFLKRSATAAVGAAAGLGPWPGRKAAGVPAPSERVTLALVGCGLHGAGWNLDQIFRNDDCQVVAVCDVDAARAAQAKARVDEHDSSRFGKQYRGCSAVKDFRELLRRQDIDAVAVCTPDHWHVLIALAAVLAGKDVICEKPLTLTVSEGRRLCEAVARQGRIFQTASENRSIDSYIRLVEAVRGGAIGRLRHITVSLPQGNERRSEHYDDRRELPVPSGFDYDMWLGPAPVAPYCPGRCHGNFRWNWDYSGGRLTDWGGHLIDLAQWANNTEGSGPIEVRGEGKFPPRGELYNTAVEFDLHYVYANGVTMNVVSRGPGLRCEGSEGWIGFDGWRAPLQASRPELLSDEAGQKLPRLYRPSEIVSRTDHYRGGEHRNFLDGVKSRKPCYSPVETGHRTASVAHLGNIAMQLGRKLQWDPQAERFVNDEQANARLSRPQRAPWTLEQVRSWI